MQCDLDVHAAKEGPVTLVLSHKLRTTMLHLYSGQQKEDSKQNLNNNMGLQQRQHLNCTLSAVTSSAAPRGDGFGVTAQSFTSEDLRSSVPECKRRSCPLLRALLKGNPPDFKSFFTTRSSLSKETSANIELNTSDNFSDERHCKNQQVRSSLAALNCGPTRTQKLDNSGGTHSTPHQKQVSSPSPSSQPSTDKVSTVGETELPTDDQIQDYISKRLAYFRTALTQKNRGYGHTHSHKGRNFCTNDRDFTLQSDCVMPKSNSVANVPTTSASVKEDVERQSLNYAVIGQCSAAVGQALDEDPSKCSKTNAELTGTLVSAVGNSTHAPKYESVEKSASADFDLPVKKHLDVTVPANSNDKHVCLDDYEDKTFVRSNDDGFHSKWYDKYLQNGMTTLHYSLAALKELIASLENVETIAKVDNFSKVILQQYWNGDLHNIHLFTSTEYPRIMMNVAATCTKNEDEIPVVLTTVPGVTFDELTEKHPSLTHNCSSSQEEYKPLRVTINKNLDDTDQVPGGLWAPKYITGKEKGHTGLKPLETVGLDNVQGLTGVTDVSEDLQTKSGSVVSENKEGEEARSVKILKDPQYEDISDDEDISQLAKKLPNTDHEELNFALCFEDISEDENPQIENMSVERPTPTQVPEHNNKQSPFENKGYGHVQGQAQMKMEIISDEKLIPKKQVSPKTETLDIAHHFSCLCFVETEDLCPKCDSKRHRGWQTNHSISCNPSSVLKDEDETDDQINDWIVIPISMSDLKFEPEDEDQNGPENVLLDDGETGDKEMLCDTSPTTSELHLKPVPAHASSQIEVFDTIESFLHTKVVQFKNTFEVASGRSPSDSEGEPHTPQNRTESFSGPEDSSETEDSCDYSSGSEHNYLTVSRQFLKRSAPLPLETEDPVSEKEDKDEVTNVQKGQTGKLDKLRRQIEAKAGCNHVQPKTKREKISKKDEIIILDSDTEDEVYQNCKKKANGKRLFSSGSESSGDTPRSQQKRHSPETVGRQYRTVKETLKKNRPLSADSLAPQCQSELHDTQFKEVTQNACSDLSYSTEKRGQLIETKVVSEQVQQKTNRLKNTKKEILIILDSDTEDGYDQYCKKRANRKRLFSSGSVDRGDAPCVQQKRRSPETVDSDYGTYKEKPQETRLSPADSSLPQHQSKLHDTQLKEVMLDACSDLSDSIKKSGHLIDAKGGSEHVQHKTIKRTTSKRGIFFPNSDKVVKKGNFSKKKVKNIHSGSEDSGDSLFATQNRRSTETVDHHCGTVNQKSENNTLASKYSPEKQPQSVDKEADSTLSANTVIPRLVVLKSSHYLKLVKESRVHGQSKAETLAPKTSTPTKQTGSFEKDTRHLYRNKKGRFVSNSKPANDGHHATKNTVQANVTKPTLFSRQLSLPSLEGLSTSLSSLPSTSGKLSEARQSSASSRGLSQFGETAASSSLPKSKQSTSIPRQHLSSSKLQRFHSCSYPSTLDHPNTPTKGLSSSATMQSSARNQVIKDWQDSFYPTRRDRKTSLGMEEDLRTTNHNSGRKARPGPSHFDRAPGQRHNPHKSAAPLMKKTQIAARELKKARSLEAPKEQRYSVGEGYKWSEKQIVAKPTKGPGRERKTRSPPSPHL